jgi:hypothetical protein
MHKQTLSTSSSDKNPIYDSRGQSVNLPLCHSHSIELFKRGQVNFIAKYEDNFKGHYGFENDQNFIDHFNETRKRFLGNWFSRAS